MLVRCCGLWDEEKLRTCGGRKSEAFCSCGDRPCYYEEKVLLSEARGFALRSGFRRKGGSDSVRLSRGPAHARSSASSGARKIGGRSDSSARSSVSAHAVGLQLKGFSSARRAPSVSRPTARQLYPGYVRKRRRGRIFRRAVVCALAVVLVSFGALGAYALWYSSTLDSTLSMDSEQAASVDAVLAPAESGKPFYMLLLGSDSREGSGTSKNPAMQGDNQRSDVMILARVDSSDRKLTMVSIPRDTPYTLDDGSVVKINELYNIGGASSSIQAVSELTGVPISHYAEVHFSELQALVDKLGGVTVEVDTELSYKDALTGERVTVESGIQTLNGQEAQIFARARHEYQTDQDAHRQSNVRALAMAILKKVLDKPLYELPDTVLDLATCVGTDMKTADIVALALGFAGGASDMTEGAINEAAGGLWLCYENPEGWARLMEVVDAGEDPSSVDADATAAALETGEEM